MQLNSLVTPWLGVLATRSRNAKTALLADALRQAPNARLLAIAVAYLSGQLPQGRIGVGPSALRQIERPAPVVDAALTVEEIDTALTSVRDESGSGSKARKNATIAQLLARATEHEQDFLLRLLSGELRQGALDGVIREAIAAAFDVDSARVRRAAMLSGSLAEVARVAREAGNAGLDEFRLVLFRPLEPMLAQTAADPEEAVAKFEGDVVLEQKLDGARIQVHRDGDRIRVFSRSLRDVTHAVPEVVEFARMLSASQFVLDGEVLAMRDDGRPQPFQVTMRRFGRRLDVDAMRGELPLTPFFFDCLHLDGADVFDESLTRRAALLADLVPEPMRVETVRPETADDADRFFDVTLAAGHEGVVAKLLSAPYEAGRRGAGWLKVKPAHTLDLVVLAAEWGSGRREGFLSNLWLGARGPDGFVMLGKTFKGLTDALLAWQTEQLLARETHREGHVVFVRPELVVEIAFDGLQESDYPGGMALRFARVKRYRSDKSVDEADTIEVVRGLASN